MKKLFLLIALLIAGELQVYATHVRAGEFSYSLVPGTTNTFMVQIRTFTEICNGSIAADQDSLPFSWGDDISDYIYRVNYFSVATSTSGNCQYCIRENIYEGTHTYSGFGVFLLSMQDVNRVAGINNINDQNSVETPMYIEDTLYFLDPAEFGPQNNSPILASLAVDFGHVGSVFHHYPNAYDPNGDSLTFELYVPFQQQGFQVPNYQLPNQVSPQGSPTFTIDPLTGDITWSVPDYLGTYQVGIKIRQYRKRYNAGVPQYFLVGTMTRDLQIIICDPLIYSPTVKVHDTCIIAGTHLVMPIIATDPGHGPIHIYASGAPFEVAESPADTPLVQTVTGATTTAYFNWQTVCDNSDDDPYIVVVKASDNYILTDPIDAVTSFTIKVVAPPPQNLTAVPQGNSVILDWNNPYACDSTKASRFKGFSVWRREGSNPFAIDTCTPGLDGKGYVEIASRVRTIAPGGTSYTYTDNNVVIGNDYCYRVLGEFYDTTSLGYVVHFVRSLTSNEACTQLKKTLPVITRASVNTTDTINGSVAVGWSNPNPLLLDTMQHPGPYKYKIYHSPDFNANSLKLIDTISFSYFNGFKGLVSDSTYTDSTPIDIGHPPIDTKDSVHSYVLKFYSDTSYIGQTQIASSIFLTIAPDGRALNLTWNENVPWMNDSFVVYRRKDHTTGSFDSIGITTFQSYSDKGLKNDSTYCYRIKSIGHYTGLPDSIINYSQERCAISIDTIGPCPPALTIQNQCNDVNYTQGPFTNFLLWGKPPASCAGDVLKYYIYYSPNTTTALTLIDSSHFVNDTTFLHQLSNTVEGCYAIAAIDSYYVKGHQSAIVCVDNCPEYNLPNTFTPNGDGQNELFVPRNPYRFIDKVAMKIYTSWGTLVFETSDPAINWDGTIASTGKKAPDGTYYYVCDVYEETQSGSSKPTKTLNGFIHLYR